MNYFQSLFSLFFPRLCKSCEIPLVQNEKIICTSCELKLPRTKFHEDPVNKAAQIFYGREKVEFVIPYLFFRKEGKVQHLLHQLKYQGKQEIGEYLGLLYAHDLKIFASQHGIELIIPVPLHPKKLRKRGFNQAESFARGLSTGLKIPMDVTSIQRSIHNPTQTKKSKYQRWENVEGIFTLTSAQHVMERHVLIVDDVLTTGSTLEAMTFAVKKAVGVKVSLATIAFADL